MAEIIGVTSGIVALVSFGMSASITLHNTIQSIRNHTKNVRELRNELEALRDVLQHLKTSVDADISADVTVLELPLYRCGTACNEFNALVLKCTGNSTETRSSFRDWAKLQYMGNDINGFKNALAGYKSTIQIALGGINLRTSVVSLRCIQDYSELIRDTRADLEEHLRQIDDTLRDVTLQRVRNDESPEQRHMQEEKAGTLQCLEICAQISSYIDQHGTAAIQGNNPSAAIGLGVSPYLTGSTSAGKATFDVITQCQEKMAGLHRELERRIDAIEKHIGTISSKEQMVSIERPSMQHQMTDEMESIKRCLDICDRAANEAGKARTNIIENVQVAEDGQQVIVSTIGDLITARGVTAGARSVQVIGQMDDDTVQRWSRGGAKSTWAAS
ncbi:Hypothetical protein R9X50_00343000 [Acrodontium crateriforme]|uniref:Azaphilone pigments biosynthesis cluster protein L N-terminal domain-containing protein n=1 Tax=Acrodontium crateriforme TaxID=150365 RepID=A0AAQ3R9W3_9PEZI|nr:Hypothetical protein R9X50_00343000 [Acrodontium crateriforme]